MLRKKRFLSDSDLPCYTSPAVQDDLRKRIKVICTNDMPHIEATCIDHAEVIKILAPLTDNFNAPDEHGNTPIYWAAHGGHTDIVKILATLIDNPNAPNNFGKTPIFAAALHGHSEIVKILAPLTDNPNAPIRNGKTPSSVTKNSDIQIFLESFNTSK